MGEQSQRELVSVRGILLLVGGWGVLASSGAGWGGDCLAPTAPPTSQVAAIDTEDPEGNAQAPEFSESGAMEVAESPKHTNELIHATSPYLLQHAHNPVDWYEWGPKALDRARAEDKPVFLSIGYSACHWCHVMEHESFSDEHIASVMNERYVNIKVDREERPDIDEIYMAYTQAVTGHGGWPMSVWLTPDGVPFYAGTYFPPDHFAKVMREIANAWQKDRAGLLEQRANTEQFLERWAAGPSPAPHVPDLDTVKASARQLVRYFDMSQGGLASGPNKFPPSMAMELLLRVHRRTGERNLLDAVRVTLDHMARGGIYDHLGGGICRYSTDPEWLVPHFEKMLYDQALVCGIYTDAFAQTRDPLYGYIARDIIQYVLGDLQSPEGGFYSTRDADSGGLEGAFYIWTVEQVEEVLGEEDAKLFCAYYDVTPNGNWFEARGHAPSGPKNILRIRFTDEAFCTQQGIELEAFRARMAAWRPKMLAAREKRVAPGLDDKILTAWNGLMIASLAKAAQVLEEPRYAEAAARSADFVLAKMRTSEGRLLRTHRGGESRLTAYLEDYAFFTEGLLNLYEATGEVRWLSAAKELTDHAITHYHDDANGGFYYTADDGEELVARSKQPLDGAIPSGNSVQAMNLLRLALLLDEPKYRECAEGIFRAFFPLMQRQPGAFERLLAAVDFYHGPVCEIVIVGDRTQPAGQAMLRAVHKSYLPNKVLIQVTGGDVEELAEMLPLVKGKTQADGKVTVYVCRNKTCGRPATTPEELANQLTEP
jgi:uncharacterized protein YyaL (SSP411 family)